MSRTFAKRTGLEMCTLASGKNAGNSRLPHWWPFDGNPGKSPSAGNQTPNHSTSQRTAKLSKSKWVYCSIGNINQIVRERSKVAKVWSPGDRQWSCWPHGTDAKDVLAGHGKTSVLKLPFHLIAFIADCS